MSEPADSFAGALARLPDQQLQALLETTPDLLSRPPADFAELAFRLSAAHVVRAALQRLDRTAVQVAALLGAVGGRAGPAALAAALSRTAPVDDEVVEQALDRAATVGVVWSSPDGGWQCGAALIASGEALLLPFLPVWTVALHLPTAELRAAAAHLGLGPVRSRADGQHLFERHFSDLAWLRQVLDGAPDGAEEFLRALLAGQTPRGEVEAWLRVRLLVVGDRSDAPTLSREVALGLLDGRIVPAVAAPPPERGPAAVDRTEPVRAALALLEQVRAVLTAATRAPLVRLQSGGIGVKEQRRLGKLVGLDERRVAWLLDLAGLAGLLAEGFAAGQPTQDTAGWLELDEVAAYLTLAEPALRPPGPRPQLPEDTFEVGLPPPLAGWPSGLGLRGLDDVARAGLQHGDADDLLAWLDWRWVVDLPATVRLALLCERVQQLRQLGLLAAGPAPWLRPLLDGDRAAAAEAFAGCLDPEQSVAVWQADATAFVAGRPSAALRGVLAAVALRESERTWRLSAERVRDSLDAGRDVEELVAALRQGSAHALPTTVEQAVRDVARRHGQIRVVPATTLLRVADRALGELLVRDRKLAALQLTVVDDIVLASGKPAKEVLAALRKAGHAPVGPDGQQPAAPRRPPSRRWSPPQQVSAADLVARLRAGTGPAAAASMPGHVTFALDAGTDQPGLADALLALHRQLTHLPPGQARRLLQAVADGDPVEVDYLDDRGRPATSILDDVTVEDGMLLAYCSVQDDEQVFAPGSVLAVRDPA